MNDLPLAGIILPSNGFDPCIDYGSNFFINITEVIVRLMPPNACSWAGC